MDSLAMILMTVPIFYPLITKLGFDPIWFGIIVVRVTEIGLITPPVGLNVFVVKGLEKDVGMGTIFRGIFPFLTTDFVHVALLMTIPQLSLFLPGLMH
jgi:C4-dicarboxylate transporter, DctM subunit